MHSMTVPVGWKFDVPALAGVITSSDMSVVTITTKGVFTEIKAVAVGSSVITGTLHGQTIQGTLNVVAAPKPVP